MKAYRIVQLELESLSELQVGDIFENEPGIWVQVTRINPVNPRNIDIMVKPYSDTRDFDSKVEDTNLPPLGKWMLRNLGKFGN